MKDSLLLGFRRLMIPIPRFLWQGQVRSGALKTRAHLESLPDEHTLIHYFCVSELPRVGEPLSPEYIAEKLHRPVDGVNATLEDLERRMTFLYRNAEGAVAWAYPVTADETPHHVAFDSGERINAAWAIDAIATPFVQGHLRGEPLTCTIKTECAHCARPIQLQIDGNLSVQVLTEDAEPTILVPMVDFAKLDDPSIIDAFWRKSVFFWSEEHAREHRSEMAGTRGLYMTLDQAVYVTRFTQAALFGFPEPD